MTLASEFSPGATPLAMPRRRRHNARKKQCGPPLLLFCLSMAIIISRIGLASGMDNIDIPTADTAIRLLSEDIDSGGDQTAADIIQFDEANNAKSEVEEEKGLESADVPGISQMQEGGESVVEQVSVAEKSKTEWPDDDDVAAHDEKESVEQVSVMDKENENTTPEWPADDDAAENDAASQIDSKMINEGTENTDPKSESEIDLDAENGDSSTIEGNVSGEGTKPASEWPEDDDDNVNDSETVPVDFNEGIITPSSHRNQSSEGETAGGENKVAVEEGEGANAAEVPNETKGGANEGDVMSQENIENNDAAAENEGAQDLPENNIIDGDASETTASGNVDNVAASESPIPNNEGNVPTEGNPSEVIPGAESNNSQVPNQKEIPNENGNSMGYYDDEDEGSFFEMAKSTFSVLSLAAFLTSLLIFRKRVMDRVETDPSVGVPGAIKDELVDIVLKLASWAANTATGSGSSGDAEGTNTSSRGASGSSRGNETIPLSTATDEEWGWEDEDMGANLELSGIGRDDSAKEDDDLALAIAMSLSESDKSGSKANGVTAASTSDNKPLKDWGQIQGVSNNKPEAPSSSAGGDTIQDLLGQMGGTDGPVITSFGQSRTNATKSRAPKAKATPQRESSDDLFESMGLSSFPTKSSSGTSRPVPASGGWQASPKSSAPLSSLLAESLDQDADADWGDDGDLDDLLDD